ncbi:MAG: ribonuclease III [Clostridiaceae bacterium]|nr:ribonuclease III [Clostridiaceae bacterium]
MKNYLKENSVKKFIELEKKINYVFKDKDILILALTHSSYANENKHNKCASNERLEFLGDAVLNVIISEKIYTQYSNLSEGEMTKSRSTIVCEASLVNCANAIGISQYLLLGKGEELAGGRHRHSILADAFEAIIGAIYIDGGIESARNFIESTMNSLIEDAIKGYSYQDYKTQLQEVVQSKGNDKITYELLEEKGPDHDKTFITQVKINDQVMGIGKGKTKKEAEQHAAFLALEKTGV